MSTVMQQRNVLLLILAANTALTIKQVVSHKVTSNARKLFLTTLVWPALLSLSVLIKKSAAKWQENRHSTMVPWLKKSFKLVYQEVSTSASRLSHSSKTPWRSVIVIFTEDAPLVKHVAWNNLKNLAKEIKITLAASLMIQWVLDVSDKLKSLRIQKLLILTCLNAVSMLIVNHPKNVACIDLSPPLMELNRLDSL